MLSKRCDVGYKVVVTGLLAWWAREAVAATVLFA